MRQLRIAPATWKWLLAGISIAILSLTRTPESFVEWVRPALNAGPCAGLTLKHDASAVRKNQSVPHQQHPALAELDVVVVLADDTRALGNQEDATRRTVVDVLRHLR